MKAVHLPVLVREVIGVLAPVPGGTYIDATVGLGGHSEEILKMIGQDGKVIGFDRDEKALEVTAERIRDDRLALRKGRFSDIERLLLSEGISRVDGMLFDLGVSMMQLKFPGRGFSFLSEDRLDMRMDSAEPLSAWEVVNNYREQDLTRILREYGEEYAAPRIARTIVRARGEKSIDTCAELAGVVASAIGRRGKTHPATKTFQAIRIEVNGEMEQLRRGLDSSLRLLGPGGRLCVISYHSLEDRAAKNFIRENAKKDLFRPLTKKPVTPGLEELRQNPSSRSAKLRGAEKTQ